MLSSDSFRIGAFAFSDTGIEVFGDPSLDEFHGVKDFVGRCNRASGWWLVDLIAYADSREDWKTAIDSIIDADLCTEQVAKNYRYIHKAIGDRRHPDVAFGHHAVVAGLEPEDQVEWLERSAEHGWTQQELRNSVRAAARTKVISGQAKLEGQYRVLLVDCPWSYNDSGATKDGSLGKAERHYTGMSIDDLCKLPVAAHSMPDAVMGFWVTAPLLLQNPGPREVIEAWGYEYKTHLVWDKVLGMHGHYSHVVHEIFCICTRGRGAPEMPTDLPKSIITIRRTGEHSEKPQEFRQYLEKHWPTGPYLELFGRQRVKGWTVFGNDARLWAQEAATPALEEAPF